MNVEAKITGIKYQPFLCKELIEFDVLWIWIKL